MTDLPRRQFLAAGSAAAAMLARNTFAAGVADDPCAPWRTGGKVSPVSKVGGRHNLHTYYLLNPESPDGTKVVFYASKDLAGHIGDIVVVDRASGTETTLVENVHTEDAHRCALQQWTLNGKAIAYHEVIDKRWRVMTVDVETKEKKIVAQDRQLGFGRGDGHTLPMYGCHWNPGEYRDLYLGDLKTGDVTATCKIGDVEKKYGDYLRKQFEGKPTSIAFPCISPDHKRAFFKMSAGGGGEEYMGKVSQRQGIVFYDFEKGEITTMREKWGHPAWHPDSFHWIEMGNILFDADGKSQTRITGIPILRGQHLAVSPNAKVWVQDGLAETNDGTTGEWAVLVGDLKGDRSALISKFNNGRGARSWRRSHPHPVFSADGKRIYFNNNSGEHGQLMVAEIA